VPTDRIEAGKKFSELCKAAQVEAGGVGKLSWGDAVAKVAKENPELARAYQGVKA
jgi:hypothetical protein